jgi:hypothetical protein
MLLHERPSLAELPHRLRAWLAGLPGRWHQWREGFRQEPGRIWYSPIVRMAALVVLVVAGLFAVHWLAQGLLPGGHAWRPEEGTRWATLYVSCTNPACRAHYNAQQLMDFAAWPLKCERCGQATVYRATRCAECRHWYAVAPGSPTGCPFCAERKAAQKPGESRPAAKTSDDAEDPW